jgi:hypothetical protein
VCVYRCVVCIIYGGCGPLNVVWAVVRVGGAVLLLSRLLGLNCLANACLCDEAVLESFIQ